MKKLSQKTTMYSLKGGFLLITIENDRLNGYPCHSALLGHEGYGIWESIPGVDATTTTFKEYLAMVEETIDEDIAFFVEEHPDCVDSLPM